MKACEIVHVDVYVVRTEDGNTDIEGSRYMSVRVSRQYCHSKLSDKVPITVDVRCLLVRVPSGCHATRQKRVFVPRHRFFSGRLGYIAPLYCVSVEALKLFLVAVVFASVV